MKGDFSRVTFRERNHYQEVLLQQGRVQLDADWNEASTIVARGDQRARRDLVGRSGSPNAGFQIAARMTVDSMESTLNWFGTNATLCVDYVDRLRGTASLRITGTAEAFKTLTDSVNLRDATISFAVKVGTPPTPTEPGENADTFSFFVSDGGGGSGNRAVVAVAPLTPQRVGIWRVYTIALAHATYPTVDLTQIQTIGFTSLDANWVYHFDSIQRDFAPLSTPLKDILALDDIEDLNGWGIPAPGSVELDATRLFHGRPTVRITGPGDGVKSFVKARDLRAYSRYVLVTYNIRRGTFFLKAGNGTHIEFGEPSETSAGDLRTYTFDRPAGDLSGIIGYGFSGLTGSQSVNVAQVLGVLDSSGSFFILGGDGNDPGRLYVDGIACQKEMTETYYSQREYPEPLPLAPSDARVDLVYADVWQRHVTYIEDPALREVALAGPDTCTRVQTIAQVKVLQGDVPEGSTSRLACGDLLEVLRGKFSLLSAPGTGTLSTLVSLPGPTANLCEIAPDADYVGLDNRLYRVEIHEPGAVPTATFKWSKDNGAVAVAVVEDVAPATGSALQTIQVERLGRDRATTLAKGDWVEISDDLTDLSDAAYDTHGLPVRRRGELRQITDVDPDLNTVTLATPALTSGYTVARHAKLRRWDGTGLAKAFGTTTSTPQLDLGDGVRITFDSTEAMLSADYWQFTARGTTGQVEQLDRASPAGVAHHFAPLALIKWKAVTGGGFEIVDIADCRPHLPALTELEGTDVGYDDACCGLTQDEQKLALWHGDALEGRVENVQQAIDALCAREHEYLLLRYVSGDGQDGLPGEELPADLVVAVENALGESQVGVEVVLTVDDTTAPSHGSLAPASPAHVQTGTNGEARVKWTLGTADGLNIVRATLATPQSTTPQEVVFNARTLAALTLRYVSGDGQDAPPGQPLAPLIVAVDDARGQPKSGIAVQFTVQAGGGAVEPATPITGPNGEATVTWTLGPNPVLNLAQAALNAPQGLQEIVFNARGAAAAGEGGCCCTITVGDGQKSHGQFNGYPGLKEALAVAQRTGNITICLLGGVFDVRDRLVLTDAHNIVISGNRLETFLNCRQGMAFVFSRCSGIELHDLQFAAKGVDPGSPLNGIVVFDECSGVRVEGCSIHVEGARPKPFITACVLIANGNRVQPAVAAPAGGLVRDCHFVGVASGSIAGVVIVQTSGAEVKGNLIELTINGGSHGVILDADSDGCVVSANRIYGRYNVDGGSLGGIHVGSGCDGTVIRENEIAGGNGLGVALGSVDDNGSSLGGVLGVLIEDNLIRDMGASGIGVLPFTQVDRTAPVPVTDDLTVSGNEIQGCTFGPALPIRVPLVVRGPGGAPSDLWLVGGIALWMGEGIRLCDNDIHDNGRRAGLPVPPNSITGIVLGNPSSGLVISRNRVRRNVASFGQAPSQRFSGGVVIASSVAADPTRPACLISENEVSALEGPALSVRAPGPGAVISVAGNDLTTEDDSSSVRVEAPAGTVQFNQNQVQTVRPIADTINGIAISIAAAHVTCSANHCVWQAPVVKGQTHLVITGEKSAIATSNRCLEPTVGSFVSLQIRGAPNTLVAIGNAVSNDLQSPGTNIGNLGGIAL